MFQAPESRVPGPARPAHPTGASSPQAGWEPRLPQCGLAEWPEAHASEALAAEGNCDPVDPHLHLPLTYYVTLRMTSVWEGRLPFTRTPHPAHARGRLGQFLTQILSVPGGPPVTNVEL